MRGDYLSADAGKNAVVIIFKSVTATVSAAEADDVAREGGEGIDARRHFRKADLSFKLVIRYVFTDYIGCCLVDVLFYRSVFIFCLCRLFIDIVVIDVQNFGEALAYKRALLLRFDIVRGDENSFRCVICGKNDDVSVRDKTS